MKAQLMLSMLLMLAVSMAFALSMAALFMGVSRAYANGTVALGTNLAESENAIGQSVLPYSEFHIMVDR
jgi:hypothetical protein